MIYTQIDLTKKRINIPNKIAGKEGESFVRGLEFIIPSEYKDWLVSFDIQNAAGEKYKKYPSKTEGNISVYEFSKKDLEARGILLIEVVLENGDKTYKPFLGEFSVKYAICAEDDSGDIFEDEDEESAELRKEIALNSKSRHNHANKEVIDSLGVNNENTRLTFRDSENSTAVLATIEDVVNQSIALRRDLEEQISKIPKLSVEVVEELPTDAIDDSTIYLVKDSDDENNLYTEYIHINGVWECLGSQSIDLTGYYTKQEIDKMGFITEEQLPKTEETDPTVPDWAKQPNKPEYTAEEVGALPANTTIPSSEDIKAEVESALTEAKESGEFKGERGQDGLSSYQIWLNAGNVGTEADYLESLMGDSYVLTEADKSEIKDAVLQELPEFGDGSNIAIDPTLTLEGFAADAKATGDRLLGVEYQTVVTDEAYEHGGLPEGEKFVVVNGDGSFGNKAYICTGEDIIPRNTYNTTFPLNGLTLTREGMTYHAKGTTTDYVACNFGYTASNINIPIDSSIVGKTLRIMTFANSVTGKMARFNISFRNGSTAVPIVKDDGSTIASMQVNIGRNNLAENVAIKIPSGVTHMRAEFNAGANIELDLYFQVYAFLDENVMTANLNEPTIISETTNKLFTIPYNSSVIIKPPIAEYIRYMSENAKGDEATYLMPEKFGAIGDGYIDDSEAIALCLEQANISKRTVLMAKKYFVASPIDIKYDGLNIIANDIVYNGSESAVKISGTKNTLKIHSINSNSIGIAFRVDRERMVAVSVNDININSITAKSHGIVFYNGLKGISQNTIKFNYIYCAGSGCYGICALNAEGDSWIGENNFYGGQISQCEWAVYGLGGNSKFYGVHPEYEVQGGYYIDNGYVTIFHSRIAESQRDGNLPIYKFKGANHTTIYDSSGIYINQIDLTEMPESFKAASGVEFPMFENSVGVINGKIICSNIEDKRNGMTSNIYTNKAYIWGKHLIMTPYMAFRKVVTTPILNTRNIGMETTDTEIRNLAQLPTKFVVNNVDSDIYLHPSYCAFGFNEFEVEQANGFTCKVYAFVKIKNDEGVWKDGSLLIFDGAEHGDGIYRFNSYKDSEKTVDHYGALYYDRSNQYWEVIKQGVSVTDDGAGNVTLTTEVISV